MEFEDSFRIRATASSAADRSFVMKEGELFALFDRFGDVQSVGAGSQGLYLGGTRHLSRLALLLEGAPPLLLSSTVRSDNTLMTVDLTNPDLEGAKGDSLRSDALHIRRTKLLIEDTYWEELTVRNHARDAVDAEIAMLFDCDYADVFEVRGTFRSRRGAQHAPIVEEDTVVRQYHALDGATLRTVFRFVPRPTSLSGHRANFRLHLVPKATVRVWLSVTCESRDEIPPPKRRASSFGEAVQRVGSKLEATRSRCTGITTNNHSFNDWVSRSFTDLHMLSSDTPDGPYPYAGIPWFSTAFGRDGIITAIECLWAYPSLARGVLGFLARNQATAVEPIHDAEPGKIFHELRVGEMARLREVPFGRYYGSIDATPLFVLLAGEYLESTYDVGFIRSLWPSIERALEWIDRYGDADGDGYVEYSRSTEAGLLHQGWKDSGDSVFHANGEAVPLPIALCEVQGYVYAAWRSAARMAAALARTQLAARLDARADDLRARFDRDFWDETFGTYVLALDGDKRPCRVRTSNAGHCLWTRIATPQRARRLSESLMHESLFSGWGVRTLSTSEVRYNPLAYHNGSVWPHDTALIALGLSRYGYKAEASRLLDALFAASRHFELQRLPEVFCGFQRRKNEAPVRYPVACLPQAWAAGSVYLLLQAVLGLRVEGASGSVILDRPVLPYSLNSLELRRLPCGEGSVDLRLVRHLEDVGVEVIERQGNVVVTAIK